MLHTKGQAVTELLSAWASFRAGEHHAQRVRNEQNLLMLGVTCQLQITAPEAPRDDRDSKAHL